MSDLLERLKANLPRIQKAYCQTGGCDYENCPERLVRHAIAEIERLRGEVGALAPGLGASPGESDYQALRQGIFGILLNMGAWSPFSATERNADRLKEVQHRLEVLLGLAKPERSEAQSS